MQILPILTNIKNLSSNNIDNVKNNRSLSDNRNITLSDNFALKNYNIPFMGGRPLPTELKENDIEECNPVKEKGKHSDKLSAVLSTALHYIKEDCPVVLSCSDRNKILDFIMEVYSDEELFPSRVKELNDLIVVEDDRILDDPVLFIKDENGGLAVIGDTIIQDKETKSQYYTHSNIILPISADSSNIKLYTTDITPVSLNEMPSVSDLKHIKKFDIREVFSKDFPDTGNIISESFSTTVPEKAKYKPAEYPMFSDIGGNKDAKQKVIEDIYAPMVFPDVIGHLMTKGTILEGPPGTGKSMLGQALCNELSKKLGETVHLQKISGAEMQISAVGGTEAKWRALFQEARDNQPALILIDEIDACTPKRDESSNARYDNSVVNQILSLMSELEKSEDKVHVIGMTNRLDAIDPAILRNGRFGNIITVSAPNIDEAGEIFDIVTRGYKIEKSFDKEKFLKDIVRMKGTGATISGIMENARKYSFRRNNVYALLMTDNITKEEIAAISISQADVDKAIEDEKEKLKKAKISSDRAIIKGFSA